ncbi:MEDS domain-containing protein [Streptomyces sp. NPDC051219]|uniref:MEDS domain-containing protein n=1 Tax=Streptomyces sp. NPDC051219 TaxID=3155283 RepID=UPI003425C428
MNERSAETPLPVAASVGGVPLTPGDHICVLHRGRAERDQLLAPYFAEGLSEGHTCLLLAAEGEGRTFCDVLAGTAPMAGQDCDSLQIQGPHETYLQNGTFDGERMLAMLYAWSAEMFPNGKGAFARVAADMSWAQPLVQPAFIDDLIQYEVKATSWLRSCPQVAMCMYDLDLFSGDLIIPLVKAHPMVWFSGMIVENPYYLAPEAAYGPPVAGLD